MSASSNEPATGLTRPQVPSGPGSSDSWFSRVLDWLLRFFEGADYFISYSRLDGGEYVDALVMTLHGQGYSCAVDFAQGEPSEELPPGLEKQLRRATFFVLVATLGACRSGAVLKEVQLARKRNRPILLITFPGAAHQEACWANETKGLRPLSPPVPWEGGVPPKKLLEGLAFPHGAKKLSVRQRRVFLALMTLIVGGSTVLGVMGVMVRQAGMELDAATQATQRAWAAQRDTETKVAEARQALEQVQREGDRLTRENKKVKRDLDRNNALLKATQSDAKQNRQLAAELSLQERSRETAAKAKAAMASRLDIAMRLSVQAHEEADTRESRTALMSGLLGAGALRTFVELPADIRGVASTKEAPEKAFVLTGQELWWWPLEGAREARRIPLPSEGHALAAAHGTLFITSRGGEGDGSPRLMLWNATDPSRPPDSLDSPFGYIPTLRVSSKGEVACGVAPEEGVVCWDVLRRAHVIIERWTRPHDTPLALHEDGGAVAYVHPDGRVRFRYLSSGASAAELLTVPSIRDGDSRDPRIHALAFQEEGLLALTREHTLLEWREVRQIRWRSVPSRRIRFDDVVLAADGRQLIGKTPGKLRLVRIQENEERELEVPRIAGDGLFADFAVSPRFLLATVSRRHVGVWDFDSAFLSLRRAVDSPEVALAAAFSADGGHLALLQKQVLTVVDPGNDGSTPQRIPIKTFVGPYSSVSRASGDFNGCRVEWQVVSPDVNRGQYVLSRLGRSCAAMEPVGTLGDVYARPRLSPDGHWLAYCSKGLKLWDLTTSPPLPSEVDAVPCDEESPLGFNEGGTLLAIVSGDALDRVELMDVRTGRLTGDFIEEEPAARITSVAMSPDSRMIALGMANGEVRLWDSSNIRLHEVGEFPIPNGLAPQVSMFSPRGDRLLVGALEGRPYFLATGPEQWAAMARSWQLSTNLQAEATLSGEQAAPPGR